MPMNENGRLPDSRNERKVLRHLVGENQSIISNDEILASRLHHFFGDDRGGGNWRGVEHRATLMRGCIQGSGSEGQRSVRVQTCCLKT